jgi:hypothetical protein
MAPNENNPETTQITEGFAKQTEEKLVANNSRIVCVEGEEADYTYQPILGKRKSNPLTQTHISN